MEEEQEVVLESDSQSPGVVSRNQNCGRQEVSKCSQVQHRPSTSVGQLSSMAKMDGSSPIALLLSQGQGQAGSKGYC